MVLSVIIPTRNRVRLLADLIDSFNLVESVSFEWEVLVIDNASTDETKKMVLEKKNLYSFNIRYICETNIGLHYCRNRGTKEAYGKYLAFLDDDMLVSSSWLSGVLPIMKGKANAVVGKILPKWEIAPPHWLLSFENEGKFIHLGLLNLGDIPKKVDLWFGGNFFISKDFVVENKGFHPDGFPPKSIHYRGDGEGALFRKFQNKNLKCLYDPNSLVFHIISPNRMTIEYLCKRAFNQGISDSFTFIRKQYFPQKITKRKVIRKIYSIIKKLFISNNTKDSEIIHDIKLKMKKSHKEGFNYHQNKVKNDQDLFNWVTKDNYYDD